MRSTTLLSQRRVPRGLWKFHYRERTWPHRAILIKTHFQGQSEDEKRTTEISVDVADNLGNHLKTQERAEKLDQNIEQTDQLIDEIVYELYGLTEKEIEIVEEAVEK